MVSKMVVLGFDGTPFTFMEKYSDKGAFKNFMRLREAGGFSPLRSVYPTVSSVAWSNFMTGVNPGRHGIFGFVDRRPGTMKIYIPNSSNQLSTTLWEHLGGAGKKVFVMNVPFLVMRVYQIEPLPKVGSIETPCPLDTFRTP